MYFLNQSRTLQTAHVEYFHSLVKYGIIFWGNWVNIKKDIDSNDESRTEVFLQKIV